MVDNWVRQAEYNGRTVDYTSSSSERALEGMCEYFGTTLNKAIVDVGNGVRLVRFSEPAIIETPGGLAVMKFQHTRFSPEESQRALEVFNANRFGRNGVLLKPVDHEKFYEELKREDEENGRSESDIAIGRVTKPMLYDKLRTARWQKGVYFVAYETMNKDEAEKLREELEKWRVHEVPEIRDALPQLHATLKISPIFFIGGRRESTADIYDDLYLDFPQFNASHNQSVRVASSLAEIDRERKEGSTKRPQTTLESRFSVYREIHSSVPRGQTFSFILAYINKSLRNKEFW